MEYQCYAYLQCDLLDRVALTIIIFKVKSLHIDMHEQYLQKYMFMKAKNFDIKLKSKGCSYHRCQCHAIHSFECSSMTCNELVY